MTTCQGNKLDLTEFNIFSRDDICPKPKWNLETQTCYDSQYFVENHKYSFSLDEIVTSNSGPLFSWQYLPVCCYFAWLELLSTSNGQIRKPILTEKIWARFKFKIQRAHVCQHQP